MRLGGIKLRVIIINRKILIISLVLILLVGAFIISLTYYQKTVSASTLPILNKVIIVDAGHGGVDGGAEGINTGVYESHINLQIAERVKKFLEESGCLVLMSRDEDMGLYTPDGSIRKKKNEDLQNRKELFEKSDADAIVSIHLNSFPEGQYYGAQTFYPSGEEKSKMMAQMIQEELIRVLDNGNTRKIKSKNDVYIMKNVQTPIVIVECGFLSNKEEAAKLIDPEYQQKLAYCIFTSIVEFLY